MHRVRRILLTPINDAGPVRQCRDHVCRKRAVGSLHDLTFPPVVHVWQRARAALDSFPRSYSSV